MQKLYFVSYTNEATPKGQGMVLMASSKENAVARASQLSPMLGDLLQENSHHVTEVSHVNLLYKCAQVYDLREGEIFVTPCET